MTISITVTVSGLTPSTAINAADVSVPVADLKTALENWLNGLQSAEKTRFDELGAAPGAPASGKWLMYFKADGLYMLEDTGTETRIKGSNETPLDVLQLQVFS